MNLVAVSDSVMSKKKTFKEILYGSIRSSFSQKKKIFVGNIKHSENEKDISLVKPVTSSNIYSDIDSIFSNSKNNDIFLGVNNNSLFGLAANTPKTKKVDTNLVYGSPFGLINYNMDENDGPLPFSLKISLDKKWVDSKIIKTQVEVSIKKSFALDINLNAVERKSAIAKT
ncbi:hypothetical protein G9A89_010497 [Geosiphon pyriformis]|nr:hypothetical protein G9A89_010497 [Geosiphon pyriformis]